jgi:hypothetical protein
MPPVRKTPLLSHFYDKTPIILPRQARDKHRESTQNRGRVVAGDGSESERFREAIKSGDLATVESVRAVPRVSPSTLVVVCAVLRGDAPGARCEGRTTTLLQAAAAAALLPALCGAPRLLRRGCATGWQIAPSYTHARASPAAHLLVSVLSAFPVCVVPPPPPLPPPLPLCFIAAVFCRWNFAADREDRPE